jgi:hypothetical protein
MGNGEWGMGIAETGKNMTAPFPLGTIQNRNAECGLRKSERREFGLAAIATLTSVTGLTELVLHKLLHFRGRKKAVNSTNTTSVKRNELDLGDDFPVLEMQTRDGKPDPFSFADFPDRLFASLNTVASIAIPFQHRFDQFFV